MEQREKSSPKPRKTVNCKHCGRFLFNLVITADAPTLGEFVQISDFRCPGCGQKAMILVALFEKDETDFRDRLEKKLEEQFAVKGGKS
jgi:hypothetical protein